MSVLCGNVFSRCCKDRWDRMELRLLGLDRLFLGCAFENEVKEKRMKEREKRGPGRVE